MKISYSNKKLEKLCEQQKTMERKLGTNSANKLRARLSDLEAAERVTDLIVGSPHELTGDRAGQYSLRLAGGDRLVFKPDHDPVPVKKEGGIDWSRVTKVKIVFVGDYHV